MSELDYQVELEIDAPKVNIKKEPVVKNGESQLKVNEEMPS
jgi:hypothetical protein